MTTYRVKISAPCEKIPWKACILEINIDAYTLNDLINKALSQEDLQRGARIIDIDMYSNEKGWLKVKI